MSENNINTVNVLSVDEERLKYRAIVSCTEVGAVGGRFSILLPPPTAFANSSHYNQCVMKIEAFTATPFSGVGGNLAIWANNGIGPLGRLKLGGVIIGIDVGSGQVVTSKISSVPELLQKGVPSLGGFRQFLPIQIVNTGTIDTINPDPLEAPGPTPTPYGFTWTGIGSGISSSDGVLAGNPFGQVLTIRMIDPTTGKDCYLSTDGNGADIGTYNFQISVTMIPNDRSN